MKNTLLLLIALGLSVVLIPLGVAFTLIRSLWYFNIRQAIRYLTDACGAIALGIDHLGNTVCRDLFNALFIKRGGYNFGNIRETISSALGKNQLRGTLTITGLTLVWLLDLIDPNHCIDAIQE